ncbi:MAG: alpha/beta hydrolase [Chthoniobacter sp.]|uniref:alpha/beta fold hydrolase n=1 Tax=Chthoniobacter sp. TaxID=2510640 RepID=UPI0032A5505B
MPEIAGSFLADPADSSSPSRTRIIELARGQRVALAEYGDPHGVPVVFCHGWPASRLQGGLLHEFACELGARIISPDRPGVGLSPAQPGRTLADWPQFLGEMADALGLGEFRVLGVSGGGPYALAAAWGLPERIPVVSVVCGAPPLVNREDTRHLNPAYQWLLHIQRARPGVLRWLFRAARPVARLRPPLWMRSWMLRSLPTPEAETLADHHIFEACFRNYRESWRGGADGLYGDGTIYTQPWGFPLPEVRVPVRLWHGKQDRNFAWELAQEMVAQLPNCEPRYLEDEAHYSLAIRHRRAILADLLAYDPPVR